MMDTRTGEFALMTEAEFRAALEQPLPAHKVLVTAEQAEIEAMSRRIRLGDQELANRRARRAQQKASRRANR